MDSFSGPGGGGGSGLGPGFSLSSQSPTPSPSPSHSASASLSASGQKRKRSDEHASSLGFPANHTLGHIHHTFSNLHPAAHSHPSSVSHESRDGTGTSIEEDDENGTGGDESGLNQSQLDSISAGDPEGKEDYEDEEEEEGNEEEADQDEEEGEDEEEDEDDDAIQTFTAARLDTGAVARPVAIKTENFQGIANVKTEPLVEGPKDAAAPLLGTANIVQPGKAVVKEESQKVGAVETIQTSGAYCAREENLKREEDGGQLKFVCYSNDGVDRHMIWLIGLKNIFARQLPNMPKEYIVRLVMDRSHKSMMIIKQIQVVGGITYRPYPSQKFGEIAFCAITADEQVKGYGTRLMNHLKQYARDVDGLTHFLTYADNNAVGYFIKQGFTKEIEMEKSRWQGYIKDYDGGTLMECKIDPKLPYTDLPAMIRRQRQAIDEKIRELSNCHIVYQGIEIPKKEAGVPRRPLRIEDIPGVKEAGWSPEQWGNIRIRLTNSNSDGPPSRQAINTFMRSVLKMVIEHADSWPFKEPVDARDVPDYYDIIKDPIDLKTISKRLDSEQYYFTLDMFVADMRRMFANARTYNSPETIYYKCANRLDAFFMNKLQAGIQAGSRPPLA
eukprot:c26328_g1_i2 orf=716-2554(-)